MIRRSFLKLVASSVIVFWIIGFVSMIIYANKISWIDDRAKQDGVFFVYELLNDTAPADRASRVEKLQPNFGVPLAVVPLQNVEQKTGKTAAAGAVLPTRVHTQEEWLFFVFEDGSSALAVGPVNPTEPRGFVPIGFALMFLVIPIIAAVVAIRVERRVSRVEKATQQLAIGDLTARVESHDGPSRELANSFNQMAERIERLMRSRDELVQAVSHELGSPLARLRFHVELFESSSDDGEQRKRAMERELEALEELVAELLGYVQSGEEVLSRETFDPSQGLQDLAELSRLEKSGGQNVKIDLGLTSHAEIAADKRLFFRAIENLLRNAMRYADESVKIEVRVSASGTCVSVHDDGPGIPDEVRESVLKPFFRLEEDRGRKEGGVGLGLAIVNRILQRHGGNIVIERSEILGGNVIHTTWPP